MVLTNDILVCSEIIYQDHALFFSIYNFPIKTSAAEWIEPNLEMHNMDALPL